MLKSKKLEEEGKWALSFVVLEICRHYQSTLKFQSMEAMVKKYQQRFRKFKDEMDRWDELQVRLISQFTNASSIIGRLQVLQDPNNYGSLSGMDGIVDALLAKQMESEELGNTVRSMEKIYRDGKQLIKGGSNQPSTKQLQQRVGLKPSLDDCLNGLRLLCDMHRSEYHLKESMVSALPELFWKPRNHSAQDLSSLQQLLVDQPNIRKEEVEFIFDTILVPEAS
ncbi:hypothetical protein SDJN02_16506, partial [Cucurbita argyrosperma subsp. argyrosperma]